MATPTWIFATLPRSPTPLLAEGTQTAELREALEKLWVNDSSFTFAPASSDALGIGFRCGFLGLLHMKIIQERLERESDVSLVQTAPTVTYEVKLRDGEVIHIESPSELPDMSHVEEIREPIVKASVIIPAEYVGVLMTLALDPGRAAPRQARPPLCGVRPEPQRRVQDEHKKTEYLSPMPCDFMPAREGGHARPPADHAAEERDRPPHVRNPAAGRPRQQGHRPRDP